MNFRISERKDRGTWLVRWFERGQKNRKTFPTRTAAEEFASAQRKLAAFGAAPSAVLSAQREAAGTGIPLDVLVRAGLEAMRSTGGAAVETTALFSQAITEFLAQSERRGVRERTMDSYRNILATLDKALGAKPVLSVGEKEVRGFLDGLRSRKNRSLPASKASKATYLRHIRMVLRSAGVREPLSGVELPRQAEREIGYFTPDEARVMLKAARDEEKGWLAVAIIAGVRPETLEKLPVEAISVKDRRIRIPAGLSKSGQTGLLDRSIIPDELWPWLQAYPFSQVRWEPLQKRLSAVIGRWTHDGLRHTAATYYCALHGVAKTASLLTHSTENLVRRHYAGAVETSTAREFYKIHP